MRDRLKHELRVIVNRLSTKEIETLLIYAQHLEAAYELLKQQKQGENCEQHGNNYPRQ